jgi:DNA-binding NarL/FixJ family response regulator
LLGRDRLIRIRSIETSLDALKADLSNSSQKIRLIVCDFDSLSGSTTFYDELKALALEHPQIRMIGLVEGTLQYISPQLWQTPIRALLAKSELGYCLHLAIRAVMETESVWVTESVKRLLSPQSTLSPNCKAVGPDKPHPDLTQRVTEIGMLRVLIGLDNSDIQDELDYENNTIREYVSTFYRDLGADSEIDAFNALSEWWSARFT